MLHILHRPAHSVGCPQTRVMESWHDSQKMPAAKSVPAATAATSTSSSSGQIQVYAEFVGSFASRYQRNNKRSGIKNLRCFPRCSYPHRSQGFCGQPVVVRFTLRMKDLQTLFSHPESVSFCAVAEFRLISDGIEPKDGSQITKNFYYSKLRNKENPMNPWIDGLQTAYNVNSQGNISLEFEFNSVKKGWHYGWVSNKHTCEAKHCLQVSLFATERATEQMTCISATPSPNFRIFCRRRSRPLGGSDTESSGVVYSSMQPRGYPHMQGHQRPPQLLNTLVPYSPYSSSSVEQVRKASYDASQFAGAYGVLPAAYPMLDSRVQTPPAAGAYYMEPRRLYPTLSAPSQEESVALQMKILSLLLKVELGEDGKLRPIARGAEALTREVSMLSLGSSSAQQVGSFDLDENMLQLKHLNLGIRVEAPKLDLGKQLSRFLATSSQFMRTISLLQTMSGDANSQTETFIRGVQEALPSFFASSYITPEAFYLQFCSTSSLLGAQAPGAPRMVSGRVMPHPPLLQHRRSPDYGPATPGLAPPAFMTMPQPQYPGYYMPLTHGAPLQSSVSHSMQPGQPPVAKRASKSNKRKSSSSSSSKPKQKRKRKEL